MKAKEINKKKQLKRKKNKWFFYFVMALVVISSLYFTKVFINQWETNKKLNFEIDQLVEEKSKLKDEITDLESTYEERESLEFVEKTAREKLGMIKAREYIVKEKDKDNN